MKRLRLRNTNPFPRVASKVSSLVDDEVSHLVASYGFKDSSTPRILLRLPGVGGAVIVLHLIKLKKFTYVTVLDDIT